MFVTLVDSKTLPPFTDLMPEMVKRFTADRFSIFGSEDKGYQLRLEGTGDERLPRAFAQSFLKKWKPLPALKDFSILDG